MASYKLVWRASAERELGKLPRAAIVRMVALAGSLAENPFPHGTTKLAGAEHTWRVRSGD